MNESLMTPQHENWSAIGCQEQGRWYLVQSIYTKHVFKCRLQPQNKMNY